LCDDQPNWRPSRFGYGGGGCRVGIRFPVVKLLDYASRQEELEGHANPFAQVVLAHLKAQETRRDAHTRRHWKTRLVQGLYQRGCSAADVRQLFRLIDWIMELPPELPHGFREDIHRFEEEHHMPYVTTIQRLGQEE